MSDLTACPNCGRRAEKSFSANWFPVHTCRKCGKKYCKECGGTTCPDCGSGEYTDHDKVHAR